MVSDLLWHVVIGGTVFLAVSLVAFRQLLVRRSKDIERLSRKFGSKSVPVAVALGLEPPSIQLDADFDFEYVFSRKNGRQKLAVESLGIRRLHLFGMGLYLVEDAKHSLGEGPFVAGLLYLSALTGLLALSSLKILVKPHSNDVRAMLGFASLVGGMLAGSYQEDGEWNEDEEWRETV